MWNAIYKHLLPRNPVDGCSVRVSDVLLEVGSSLVYGLSELCGPFGENGEKYPCDGAENHLKASLMQLEEMKIVSVDQQGQSFYQHHPLLRNLKAVRSLGGLECLQGEQVEYLW